MIRIMMSICLILLLLPVPLAGCSPSREQIANQTATAQTAIAALWTSTPQPTSTQTPTTVPSLTLTPTKTPTRTAKPTITPSSTATQTPTQAVLSGQPTTITTEDVTFSLVSPEGFEVVDAPDGPVLLGPTFRPEGQAVVTFKINPDENAGSMFGLFVFAALVQDGYAQTVNDLVQLEEDFPSDDHPYFRWVIESQKKGDDYHEVFYIFDTGTAYLVVLYSRPNSAGEEYDELVDLAIQTLKFEP